MAKTTKSGKSSRKAVTGGMIAVIVAIILIIACFFTYISGILPLTMTGISITETLADGSTKTVKNYSLLETNLHFKQTLSTYSSYGMVSEDNLDDIYNQETGETYRDWLLKQTAGDMESIALVERAAKQAGFMDMSAARKIASLDAETLDLYAQIYGFQTGSQYLAALYGTGMSKRAYTDYMARTTLADEYVSYLKQFDPAIVPTDDKIQADFDADPSAYTTFDFNYFFVGADTDADGNVTGLKEAVAAAKKISDATTDSASFRQACMDYLTEKDDQNSLASFANDQDPTFCDNYTTTTLTYLSEEITSFITGDSVTGDKTVIETDKGAYVVYIAQKGIDEADSVGAGVLAGLCHRDDIRDVGGELDDDRLGGHGLHRPDHGGSRGGVGTEAHAAAVDVGAGDVDLQPADLGQGVQLRADLRVFFHGKAADVGHDRLAEAGGQPGKLRIDDPVYAGVLQAHGVQHPGGAVRDPGRGVAEAGLPGRALEGERAQDIDIVQLREFIAIAEGAGGGDDGIVQRDAAEGGAQSSHRISSFCSTGPSLQIRFQPVIVLQEQPMQAPKPQPMRRSKLKEPPVLTARKTALSMGSGPQV